MMSANIDTLYVHLFDSGVHEQRRINLFKALGQMRAAGYDVPKVVPFLDPPLTWFDSHIDVATAADKDDFANQYIRFYNQYFSVNTDAHADSYIGTFDGRPILDTWHVNGNLNNINSLTRSDVTSRLASQFGAQHPLFNNNVYMITTALNPPTLAFADEKVPQFEVSEYYRDATFGGIRAAQLKAGYWDQNIRNPGSILPRDGGTHYKDAWNQAVTKRTSLNLRHINVESWNEYDEGSGIYAANAGPPFIQPGSGNTNTDTWSATGDPYEYIKTTADGARQFNDTPDRDARILWENFPTSLKPGETRMVSVVVRNQGDLNWSAADQFKLGQQEFVPGEVLFGPARYLIDDTANEIPTYGGIFRGRPITFHIPVTAPTSPGTYPTHWGMLQELVSWFGEVLVKDINVTNTPAQQVTNVGYDLTLPGVQFAGGGVALNIGLNGSGQSVPAKLTVGTINVDSGNNNVINSTLSGNTLNITSKLTIAAGSTVKRTGPGVMKTASLDGNGTLDLTDTKMVIDYTGSSPINTIRSLLASGFAAGAWNGVGINSSTAASIAADSANSHKAGVGYAEAAFLQLTSFGGEQVDSSSLLVRYTLAGDTNLDGVVNSIDFAFLAASFGLIDGQWFSGDFNYDGKVNALDFNLLASNYGYAAPASLQSQLVPEPWLIAAPLILALGSVDRRGHRYIGRKRRC
jgi:hypothetical protein